MATPVTPGVDLTNTAPRSYMATLISKAMGAPRAQCLEALHILQTRLKALLSDLENLRAWEHQNSLQLRETRSEKDIDSERVLALLVEEGGLQESVSKTLQELDRISDMFEALLELDNVRVAQEYEEEGQRAWEDILSMAKNQQTSASQ